MGVFLWRWSGSGVAWLGGCWFYFVGMGHIRQCTFWWIGPFLATNVRQLEAVWFLGSQGVQQSDGETFWPVLVGGCLGRGYKFFLGRRGFRHHKTNHWVWIWTVWGDLHPLPGGFLGQPGLFWGFCYLVGNSKIDSVDKQWFREEGYLFVVIIFFGNEVRSSWQGIWSR